ncbi:MAG: glucosidase [Planctomycetes bacterium]|nr:glucosidase [Planctomycetota bacterium]
MSSRPKYDDPESRRLEEDASRASNWKRWGPYVAERQWGTVREDYSADGSSWDYFTHDQARSRAYRWGEDGLFGFSDRQGRLCFALGLWNGRDPILKERLFGVTGPQGNHGEDVKECYYYLDATPTHSYMRALYKYPQRAFPYEELVAKNGERSRAEPEFELVDTGIFDGDRYFDVFVEYAKNAPEDLCILITAKNRAPEAAELAIVPTLWFRNTWSWGRTGEAFGERPRLTIDRGGRLIAEHSALGRYALVGSASGAKLEWLLTENETNTERLFQVRNATPYVKDGFHAYVIDGDEQAVHADGTGTKAGAVCRFTVPAKSEVTVRLRLHALDQTPKQPLGDGFDAIVAKRAREADLFYAQRVAAGLSTQELATARQAYAGLLWSKQFYYYVVREWLEGDPAQPAPPEERKSGRNAAWNHLYNRDVISMPDKWEYPWYAAWDLAFHMIPFARVDIEFAKSQLSLFLREWYMHPNGQIPAYEWALGDVNPPVHAWACWRIYKKSGRAGARDRAFLSSAFQKLLLNFTWWVNRKDAHGKHIFSGGFLGLDNIGVFDRSQPLPTGGHLEQADGTAWMAFYCGTMLSIALELAKYEPAYEDMASKFFEHFVAIAEAMNALGEEGLWDERDGFYYDQIHKNGDDLPLRMRSMVGLIPLIAVEVLEQETIDRLPGFKKRMNWFLENRPDLAANIAYATSSRGDRNMRLLAIPSKERLARVLRYMLDESEFLSPYGIRSLSRTYADQPYVLDVDGAHYEVRYAPGDATSTLFGGNSNWRGPVWFPVNYLLIEALERYHHFYGDDFKVECPTSSGNWFTLRQVAEELGRRLARLFLPNESGARPCHGSDARYANDPHWKDLVLFHEYFHGDDGHGLGASHQTGWTALVATLLDDLGRQGAAELERAPRPARSRPRAR